MKHEREVRFLPMEIRAEQDETKKEYVIEGYPIVFNQTTDMGDWEEVIDPAAVGDGSVLRDVALMIGHDFGMIPLAHSRRNNENSTMQLVPNEHGVHMRAALDAENNPRAAEAYSAVGRGGDPVELPERETAEGSHQMGEGSRAPVRLCVPERTGTDSGIQIRLPESERGRLHRRQGRAF